MEDGNLRISASQINRFLEEPAIWVLNKFHKFYDDAGAKAWVGTAVEKGMEAILVHGWEHDKALEWSLRVFDTEAIGKIDEDAPEERARIPALLGQAIEAIIPFGKFRAYQAEVEGTIEGVPIKAKIDFDFEGPGDLDLKTTKAMKSCAENISADHLRQLAIYEVLRGRPQYICYVTEKKRAIYLPPADKIVQAHQEIRGAVRAMKAAYDLGQDMAEKLYPPRDYSSYLWDHKVMKKAKEVWQ